MNAKPQAGTTATLSTQATASRRNRFTHAKGLRWSAIANENPLLPPDDTGIVDAMNDILTPTRPRGFFNPGHKEVARLADIAKFGGFS